MSKTTIHFLLSILSALLLSAAWPINGFTFIIFGALIPLLFLENSIQLSDFKRKRLLVFGYGYLTFLLWNILITWWLINSSLIGMLFANICNSLFYAIIFTCFSWAKKRLPNRSAYLFLIALWIAFEKLHLSWDFSWTWLNLGNVFSENIYWIQWYEYTGVFGGSLWVLVINVWLFHIFKNHNTILGYKPLARKMIAPLMFIALPIAFSLYLYEKVEEGSKDIKVLLVQPNIDPYSTKYSLTNANFFDLWKKQVQPFYSDSLDYILSPETYFAEGYGEEFRELNGSKLHEELQHELAKIPLTQYITGIQLYDLYAQENAPSLTANQIKKGLWADYYNSALAEQSNEIFQIYHKSKLVVGVENMPFKSILKPLLGDVLINFGGTVASRVTQKKRAVFSHTNSKLKAAPIICWESIFGEFVTGYVNEGATFLAVISNDAWWGETPGHRQLLSYTRLRAIETRRDIARSANTGISSIINAKGEIINQTSYNTKTILSGKLSSRTNLTFYVRFGDIIARWSVFVAGLFFLIALSRRIDPNKIR
jgi:apolipoprotein N-acyltransferase|tara:strand:- start:599 stop:2215 length:1617 start_codon:yes stop_codon:yes gene_type:complete